MSCNSMMKILAVTLMILSGVSAASAADPASLYAAHCAECHEAGRLGAMGPALLPENLGRLSKKNAFDDIANGRPATQMPGYKDKLSKEEIDALVTLIYTPLTPMPI